MEPTSSGSTSTPPRKLSWDKAKRIASNLSELNRLMGNLDYDEKDLETDEAVSKLYDRWVEHHNLSRTPQEKAERIEGFKTCATRVLNHNRINKNCTLCLSRDADKILKEELGGYVLPFKDMVSGGVRLFPSPRQAKSLQFSMEKQKRLLQPNVWY